MTKKAILKITLQKQCKGRVPEVRRKRERAMNVKNTLRLAPNVGVSESNSTRTQNARVDSTMVGREQPSTKSE